MGFYKSIKSSWVRRRWLDFRQGHSIYLVFLMTFANFITIQYALLIEKLPVLKSVFDNVIIFAALFIAFYMPVAIIIGYWHRRSQWSVEQEAMFRQNTVQARMYLFLIDLIEGRATEEERREMKNMLRAILKKPPLEYGYTSDNKREQNQEKDK